MNAIVVQERGDSSQMKPKEVPIPQAGDSEVRTIHLLVALFFSLCATSGYACIGETSCTEVGQKTQATGDPNFVTCTRRHASRDKGFDFGKLGTRCVCVRFQVISVSFTLVQCQGGKKGSTCCTSEIL